MIFDSGEILAIYGMLVLVAKSPVVALAQGSEILTSPVLAMILPPFAMAWPDLASLTQLSRLQRGAQILKLGIVNLIVLVPLSEMATSTALGHLTRVVVLGLVALSLELIA